MGDPPVAVVYHNKLAPDTKPPAVSGPIVAPSQNTCPTVVGAVGLAFTVTVIGLLGPSQLLADT